MKDASDLITIDPTKLADMGKIWGLRLAIALVILLVGYWIARSVAEGLRRVLGRAGADPLLGDFLRNLVMALLLAIVVVGALDRIGVPTTSLLAALGAAGLAIGLALQNSLSNIAAGTLLMVFRPFRVGDYVEVAGVGGTVQRVSLMHTFLLTPDNREVIMPNAKVAAEPIVNANARGTRRVDLVIPISFGDDVGKAIGLLRDAVASDARILSDPVPDVAVMQYTSTGVAIAVRPWVKSSDYWGVQTALLRAIKEKFDGAGITIPNDTPKVVLHASEAPRKAAPDSPEK